MNQIVTYVVAAVFGSGGLFVAKTVGDTIWLPINSYQQEKLYDLEDEAEQYTDRESLGETLSPLDLLNQKRLLKRIKRLTDEIN